jgi:acetyl esterase/lipase
MVGEDRVDPAFAALLSNPRAALRRIPSHVPVAEFRAAANDFLANAPREAISSVVDLRMEGSAGSIPARLYRPSRTNEQPLILFIHGGGFLFGNLETHDALCRLLAICSGTAVMAIDYRLAPEHIYPAARDDCRAAVEWIVSHAVLYGLNPARLAIAGDSAGGQLAIATALHCRDVGLRVAHLGLLYPLIDPIGNTPSAHRFGQGHLITRSFLAWCWEAYGATQDTLRDPMFNLTLADLAGLPPTTVVTACCDPLRDDGETFARRLSSFGVKSSLTSYPGMIHGFAGMPHLTPVAKQAIAHLARSMSTASATEDVRPSG